ncbi:uncharacterized protein LOC111291025 [Durio zibethinus]|uniref:Uncharacterized protein LOC111291025 n=1 Tax=Durio zibethinus TaxID=66656 RepID=A0A6P5YE53_DURZI|nr:uncharacterized protein LOC111291025 [Durio zibethinus]
MDLSSSLPESQQRLPNHDHQQLHNQSTQSCYYPQQNQQQPPQHYYSYNGPPGYAYYQVPHQQSLESVGVSVNTIARIADSVWTTAQVGLNPVSAAAVVALSQLAQFQRTATAGMHPYFAAPLLHHGPTLMPSPPASGSPYNSGGREGIRSFRRHGRGYIGQCSPKTGDHETGSGEGRGGPQCFKQHGASSASQQEPYNENIKSTDKSEPLAVLPKETAQTAVPPKASRSIPMVEKVRSSRRPPQGAWCALCRVECTSLEILEQHKNGKRHKRNLQKNEESKIAVKPGMEKQNGKKPTAKLENEGTQQLNSAQENEEKKPVESVGVENSVEPIQQINGEKKHIAAFVEETPRIDCFDSQRLGMKRKMQGGQEGECTKSLEAPRLKVGPCKRKVVIPLICDLCNVKCDTQDVFDCHLSGEKHTAKLKQFGPVGLQVLYPSNPTAKPLLLPQSDQQPVRGSPGSHLATEAYIPPQTHKAAPVTSGLNLQNQQNPNQIAAESASIVRS